MDGGGLLSCQCIERIDEQRVAPELSRANVREGDHASTLVRAAEKRNHQILTAVTVEIYCLRELECGIQRKHGHRRLKAAIWILIKNDNRCPGRQDQC